MARAILSSSSVAWMSPHSSFRTCGIILRGFFLRPSLRSLFSSSVGFRWFGYLIAPDVVVRHLPAFSAPLWVLLSALRGLLPPHLALVSGSGSLFFPNPRSSTGPIAEVFRNLDQDQVPVPDSPRIRIQ